MVILDTNVLVHLLFENFTETFSEEVINKAEDWLTPHLTLTEFSNVIVSYYRNKMITYQQALDLYTAINMTVENRTVRCNKKRVLEFALESNLSIYDSEFVTLAKQKETILITNDKKIVRNFPEIALTPKQYLELT